MVVKNTTSDSRQYVKLVEAFRDNTGVARQRVIATLGRIESVRSGGADSLVTRVRQLNAQAIDLSRGDLKNVYYKRDICCG